MIGLFSLLEAMTDQPLPLILKDLPLEKDVEEALLGRESPFTPLLRLVKAYEEGRWQELYNILKGLPISDEVLPKFYIKALSFAQRAFVLGK
ncbi:EAL domain protein [Thermosulfurimonas dismutans]|uniref:EAL domain protein n=1 Tax=Thermosulfurimonas dismutans TaxID=999894 RepID=A0A179D280_9BACT|nr:EAL domain protein [Thermosulfurimonas dismutans]